MGEDVKGYKSYAEQVALLERRGMDVGVPDFATETLRRINYYRLSGYWYPFRKMSSSGRQDDFFEGTKFSDVVSLYDFDARLRTATFTALMPLQMAVGSQLRSWQVGSNHLTTFGIFALTMGGSSTGCTPSYQSSRGSEHIPILTLSLRTGVVPLASSR